MTATVAGIHLGRDTHANRPAANTNPDGSLYSCSTHGITYKSNYAGNTWATWAPQPGFEFDYVQITGTVNVAATTEGTATTVVTGNAIAYDGSTIILVEFFCPYYECPTNVNTTIVLYDGSSSVGKIGLITAQNASSVDRAPLHLTYRFTPSAATKTYSIRAYVGSGTGIIGAGAAGSGNYMPGVHSTDKGMTLATRLLPTGTQAFAITLSEVAVTASPNGGWPGFTQAYQRDHVVYFGWVDSAGNVEVAAWNDDSGTLGSPFTLHATLQVDWHNAPGLARLSDGRLLAAYCAHSGVQMYMRKSTNPDDVTAWGSEATLDAQLGGFQYTYPLLFVEPSGTVWLFYRDDGPGGNGEPSTWCYSTSMDGGVTWAAQTELWTTVATVNGYMRVDYDGDARFDFLVTNGSADADNANTYHFWMDTDGDCFETDGTPTTATRPLDETDCTLVHAAVGGARYAAGCVGNDGFPVVTWPEWTAGAKDYYYGAWNGSAWIVTNVVSDGGTGAPWVEGGFQPDYSDPSIAWLSREVSGKYEVFRYRTFDFGVTWTSEQISASPSDDFYPVSIRDAYLLQALWLRGTASSSTSYTLSVMGATR